MSQNQATDDGGSSYGDSGGPIFWEWEDPVSKEKQKVLVAITSWGDAPCVATAFAYRADTPDTHGLIEFTKAWLDTPMDDSANDKTKKKASE